MRINRDEIRATIAAQLGSPVTDIADHDDLIQVGLNSIRMMALAGGWRKQGADVTFAELAASPTIESWHGLLSANEVRGAAEPVADRPTEPDSTTHRSRWPPCSTRTGSADRTNKSSVVSPRTSMSNSMAAQ